MTHPPVPAWALTAGAPPPAEVEPLSVPPGPIVIVVEGAVPELGPGVTQGAPVVLVAVPLLAAAAELLEPPPEDAAELLCAAADVALPRTSTRARTGSGRTRM